MTKSKAGGSGIAEVAATFSYLELVQEFYSGYHGHYYKKNADTKEIIGVKDASLHWGTTFGVDNNTDDAGNSGLHLEVFDVTTRGDSAQIKLENDSGSPQHLVACIIKAKPIWRLSGENGFIHDDFVDYESIYVNGERLFELGNNYIILKSQVEKLADLHWKLNKNTKHIYVVVIYGTCYWYEPGEWYTLTVGGAGQQEYIDSKVECYDVQIERTASDLGTTMISFREVEENWKFDSNALARFMASGNPVSVQNYTRVIAASATHMGTADYYCDGTADQIEIQAAIDYVAGTHGGGIVELTQGQYNITAAINLDDNIILQGQGAQTIIKKNCNDSIIKCIGTSGTVKENACVKDLKLDRADADTNVNHYIQMEWTDNLKISNTYMLKAYASSIYLLNCADAEISHNIIDGCNNLTGHGFTRGIQVHNSNDCTIIFNTIKNIKRTGYSQYTSLLYVSGNRVLIQGNVLKDCYTNDILYGMQLYGDQLIVNNNVIENVGAISKYTISAFFGAGIFNDGDHGFISSNFIKNAICNHAIYNYSGEHNTYNNNYCIDNGQLIDRANCEETTAPMIFTETVPSLSNATFARSSAQKYECEYSYLATKTNATGVYADVCLVDNNSQSDMHGLIAGLKYEFSLYVYVPSSGGPSASEITIRLYEYYSSSWHYHESTAVSAQDVWELLKTSATLNAATTGIIIMIYFASTAAINEYIYIDNVRLQPLGINNEHEQNFKDVGTGTIIG